MTLTDRINGRIAELEAEIVAIRARRQKEADDVQRKLGLLRQALKKVDTDLETVYAALVAEGLVKEL